MYDELVATLRRQCIEMACGNCKTCVNRQAADAIERLEAALILMVLQYCTDEDGTLWHQFMSAGEGAFDALGITLKTNPKVLWDRLEKKEAADAIEERCQQVDKFAEEAALLYAKLPHWIPVTEQLPEKMQYVLVRYKNNDMAVASWFGGDEDIRFWRVMTDEGWCADCDTEPTHWMPMPEPPKEE